MSEESTKAADEAPPEAAQAPAAARATGIDCLCLGLGPQLTQALRAVLAVDGVSKALHDAELDALKLLRSFIDQRIASLDTKPGDMRGTKVSIE